MGLDDHNDKGAILAAIRDSGGSISGNRVIGGNLSKAARSLGIARKTLYNRMRELGLRGIAGRPKKRMGYSRSRKRYAIGAAAVAVIGVALIARKRGTSA